MKTPLLAPLAAAVLLALGFCVLPALIPGYASAHWVTTRFWLQAGLLTAVPVLLVAALPWRWPDRVVNRLLAIVRRPSPLVFALCTALLFTAASAFLAWYAYGFAPSTADEIAQLWHARILLHGHLALPADPNFEFFAVDNVIDWGAWYSQYPIGGPLVLALGYLLHARWLLDPVLGGLTAVALYHFARKAYGETQGRAAALLFVLCPVTLLMSASFMNHVPVLLLTAAALAALPEWEGATTPRRRVALSAGIGAAVGFMATIRPLDALVVAVAVGAFQLPVLWRTRHRRWELAVQALAGFVGAAPLLIANRFTTGSAFRFGYGVMWGPAQRIGFHMDPMGVEHTPFRALILAAKYVSELNQVVVGWPLPALLVVIAGLVAMRRTSRWDRLLFALFGAQLLAYALYWHDGEFIGPRFLYTAVPAVIVMLARAPFLLAERWGNYWRRSATLLVLACIGVGWLVPGSEFNALGLVAQYRHARANFKLDLAGATRAAGAHGAVVFVHEAFSGRLMRRLWGVGFTRGLAERVFARSDACSILDGVQAAEADTAASPSGRVAVAMGRIRPFVAGPAALRGVDPIIHITSAASVTPSCREELTSDVAFGGMPFGLGLLLEPVGADGRLDGDVIYATDLGDRDELLRQRFGHRMWYRTRVRHEPDGRLDLEVVPYERATAASGTPRAVSLAPRPRITPRAR